MVGFCIASGNVHSQKFEDEVVVLDTKSGLYLSLGLSSRKPRPWRTAP